ncbi:YfhO family protein [Desulfococcaceae bacterium HSG8]|nr:YfhO family protein [Desulfococcaceae bacterium HSG8]
MKTKYLKKFLPISFIFILTIIFFSPVIFQGKTFYAFDTLLQHLPWETGTPGFRAHNTLITDPVNIFYPYYHFIKECMQLKTLSFWRDSNFCGIITSPTGHPLAFLFYLFFSVSAAHDLLLWLHLFGAGLFMFLYLRERELKSCPALIGAVSWMFNGYVMVWFEFENVVIMAPAFAASLYYMELWLKKREKLHCLCFTCAIALSLTNGSAQLNIYQLIFIAFYFVYRYLSMKKRDDFQSIGKKELPILLLAVFLLVCISSSFLFKHLSLLDDPHRREFSFDELYYETGKLPVSYLTTLIFPDFFGTPAGNNISFIPRIKGMQPYNNYNELCIYSGIVPLFLILACLPFVRDRRDALFYFLTAIITVTMAMGSILYYPMWKFIPGLNLSAPARILYIFGFCMAVLAGIGADILMAAESKKKRVIIILWSLLLATAVLLSLFVQTEAGIKWASNAASLTAGDQFYRMLQKHFALSSPFILEPLCLVLLSFISLVSALIYKKKESKTIFLSLAILIVTYDLISFGLFYNTASPRHLEYPETDAIRFLKKDQSAYRVITYGNFMHNSFVPFGIQEVGGYSSFYPKRYGEYLHLSQDGPDVPFPDNFSRWTYFRAFGSPLLDLINIKYLLIPPHVSLNSPKLRLAYNGEVKIYENTDVFPRVFFVPTYQLCESRAEAYKALGTYTASDFRKRVILESLPPEDFQQTDNPGKDAVSDVRLISYSPGKMEIEVSTDQKGFLVISGNYHPSWRAETDGSPAKVFRANYIMRALPVKAGSCKVMLTFRHDLIISGVIITSFGWVGLGLLIVVLGFVRRQR